VSAVQFDHDARLFDEVAMAQEVRPYAGQPKRYQQVDEKQNRVCCD
jgi:hypothetical protein